MFYSYPYYIGPIEIGLLWTKITYLKSHSMALGFLFQTDMSLIFQMRKYIDFGQGAAKYQRLELEVEKIDAESAWFDTNVPVVGWIGRYFFDI